MPTYYEELKKVAGIYCLTDTKTGKMYIGSATGGEGVTGLWSNYLDSKRGGNKKLIIEREHHWKRCLDTINNGYNDK